ncbi:universal stress protein [Novosphingobium album (ex Liu et al. 2023)]|uniref:Universal stress protein n=1 Tax=Novosphingobium album (ex Liu et al. 2023) TaxID=3031130 RepID=A0ABT5WXL8_9SPHN|nr:universal stress protein [Novosphingobium album (ex Liu et al. 2023)]MDE8654642.1 universal stress protein [Novosphingobium album (ex Liu et al. 2023)]
MPVRDIILQMNSYPEPTPGWALEAAVSLAQGCGARLSAGVCEVYIPPVSNWLANKLVNADGMIAAENHKSSENAKTLLSQFSSTVGADLVGETLLIRCPGSVTHWQLAAKACAYDLIVVPVYGHQNTIAMTEGLIFEAGRPVLLLPEPGGAPLRFDHVVIGWDGSRAAARALADSLSFCRAASKVTIASVTKDKDLSKAAPVSDVVRHLGRHDVAAEAIEIPADGSDAGLVLQSFCERSGGDLLVMGAYGHSRVREFVLGGATRSVLEAPKLPIFLSH